MTKDNRMIFLMNHLLDLVWFNIREDDDDPLNVMLKAKTQMTETQLAREPLASSSASSHEELLSSTEPHGKDLHQPRDAKPSLPTPKDKPLAIRGQCALVLLSLHRI